MRKIVFILFFIFSFNSVSGKNKDSIKVSNYKFIPLPVISYNSDIGLQYGAITNLFYYGKHRRFFPDYKTKVYTEWSASAKGSKTIELRVDYKEIFKNFRGLLNIGINKELALPFFGFEYLTTKYNRSYINPDNNLYKSIFYYNIFRQLSFAKIGGYLDIWNNKLKFFGDINFNKIKIDKTKITGVLSLSNNNDTVKNNISLYNDFIKWGLIDKNESTGGEINFVSIGITYNTRKPVEVNPYRGMYAELITIVAPKFLFNNHDFARIYATYKQFIEIINKRLVLGYRISISKKLYGCIPFYAKPFFYTSLRRYDALGGVNTVRGFERDRFASNDFGMMNLELRSFPLRFNFLSHLVELSFYPYADFAMPWFDKSTKEKYNLIPDNRKQEFNHDYSGKLFYSYGLGSAFVIDYNLVLNLSFGVPYDKDMGTTGISLGLDYVF